MRVRRNAIIGVIGALTAVSLGYSLYDTAADPSAAYFITPTRAWEFGARRPARAAAARSSARRGSRAPRSRGPASSRSLLAAFLFTENTPFPGYAALLPVLGALAVIAAGAPIAALGADADARAAAGPVPRQRLLLASTSGTGRC